MDYQNKTREELIQELTQSNDRYRFLIENINDIIYEYDEYGILKYISPVVEKTFGYKPEEIVGKNFIQFVGGDEDFAARKLKEISENKVTNTEYEIKFKNGQTGWIQLSTRAVFEDNKFIGGAGTLTNITKRKQIETELNRSEQLYRSVINASPDTITITDLQGKVLFTSPSTNTMFAYEKDHCFDNSSILEFIDPSYQTKAQQAIAGMFNNQFTGAEEYVGIKADGTKFEIEVNGEFIRDKNGQPVNMIFVTRDISLRKLSEANLNKVQSSYKKLVENINDIIYDIDKEGFVQFISPNIYKLTGYQSEEIVGQNFLDLIGEDRSTLKSRIDNITHSDYITNEYKLQKKNGETIWVRFSSKANFENNEFAGASGTLTDITANKITEIELQKSESLYSSILTASPDAITIVDLTGKIVFASHVNYKIFGYDSSFDFRGHSFYEFVDPSAAEEIHQTAMKIIGGEKAGILEYKGLKQDGSMFDLEVNAQLISDEANNPVKVLFVVRDTTEKKQLEENLQKSEAKFKNLVENINEVVYEIDQHGIVKYVSPAIIQIGYLPEEMIGQSFLKFAGNNAEKLYNNLINIKQGEQITSEYEVPAKDGSLHWLRFSTKAHYDNDGVFLGGNGTLVDVTRMKLTESKLEKSEEKYRQMVERINDVIFEADINGTIIYVSPAIEKVLGYSAEELTGKNFYSYMYPEDRTYLAEAFAALESKDSSNLEYRFYKKDGEICWVRSSKTPVITDGVLTGGIGILTNINERKLAEEELRLSEMRYKTFFEGNASTMILIDPETGEIRDANPAACLFYGYTKKQLCNLNIADINTLPKEETHKLLQFAKKQEHKHVHLKHQLANGELRTVEVYSGPMQFGNTPLLHAIIHDITERTEIENNLRISEEKYRSIFETVQDAYYEASLEGILLDISPAIYSISKGQYTREELIGKSFLDFYSEPDARTKLLDQLAKHGHVNDYELNLQNKDGSISPVSISSTLIVDENNKPVKVTGSMRDIEERKKNEKLLLESEEKYRLLFLNNPQPMWIYDLETLQILEVNESSVIQYGYSREEFLQMTIKDIRPTEDIPDLITDVHEDTSMKNAKRIWRHLWKNSELRYVEITTQSVDFNGRKAHHVLINDVTEKIQAENEIKNKSALLTNLIINLKEGILLEDANRNIALTNQLFCDMFNLPISAEQLIGENCSQSAESSKLLFKNPEKFVRDIDQILVNRLAIFNDELELADGRYFERDYIPTYIDGIYNGHLWKYRDITERKNATLQLTLSEERFRQVVEQSQEVVWETDALGMYTFVSPLSLEIFGYTPDEMIGKLHFYDICPINEQEELKKVAFELFEKKMEIHELVNKIVRKDGQVIVVLTNGAPIIDKQGNLIGYRGLDSDITERKRTEDELRKVLQAVEQSPVSIVITNTNGDIEYANPKSCESTGYNLEELKGNNPRVLQSGETPKSEYLELWETITKGNSWHGTFHNKRKNGELYWESSTIAPITNKDGIITHFVAIKEDITHLKESEEALIRNEANLNYAQEIGNMGSWEYDLITNSLTGSRNYHKMFGLEFTNESDDIYSHFLKIVHPEDIHILNYLQEHCFYEYKTEIINIRVILPDGQIKIFQNNIVPVFESDKLVALRGVNLDITEQKQKDDMINRLSKAVTQSPTSVVITDVNGNIEFVNPAFEKATGLTFEMVKGKNTRILKSGITDQSVYTDLWRTIKQGKIWETEWRNKRRNGEIYWEAISISPIFDNNGNITNYLAIKQDVTQKKNFEQEILDLNQNLEKKIQIRTKELEKVNSDLLTEITERIRVEQALSESEFKYRSVVENIQEVIFQTDYQGNWQFLNNSWEKITGYTVEESIGKLFLNYVHPDDRQRNMEFFEPLIKREKDYCRHEIRYMKKEGGYCWIEVFARLGVNENNEVIGTYGSLKDITEQKLAEEFEQEMLLLSAQLTAVSTSAIDSALNLALSRISNFLHADRSYIFEIHQGGELMSNTYEWCNEGITKEIDNLSDLPLSVFPMWMQNMRKLENVIITSVSELPQSWENERLALEPQGIKSLIALPLVYENNFIGFVGLDSVVNYRIYSQAEINILKVWSSMLSTLIMNKRTESLLEMTRQNFKVFFNTIDDFLWVLDQEGNILHVNDTVVRRLGYNFDELKSKSILKVHPESRRDEAAQIVVEMINGTKDICPVPIITRSGNQIPVETHIKHGLWNGKPAIFGVSKDISKIQLSEQKFSTAFQSSAALMAISIFDSGKYVDINKTFQEVTGYSREELIGKTSKELKLFLNEKIREEVVDSLKSDINVRDIELELKTKAGEIRTVLLSADSIYVGEEHCLLTVSVDITDRKNAEEEIKKARQEAEKANIAKSEFLSRMSHELRTPMNSILGFSQILEMGELTNGQRKGVNHIMQSGKHLLSLINEVLDISRIEAGRLSISIEPIKISTIYEEMFDIMRPIAQEKHVQIVLNNSVDNNLFVKSDRQSLKQIMLNLLTNSIKYNKPDGHVYITTKLQAPKSDGIANIRISITDTGLGIAPNNIAKVFTPFERIGADKTGIEGTGLGLAVVKKLIDAMGGEIGVESVVNEGSTFWFELPEASGQLENLQAVDNPTKESTKTSIGKSTILYIEDNISNIELVDQILSIQRPNIQLINNMNGKQALSMAIEHKPNLILLDLNLPDMHGSEVLKQLQNNDKSKHIPVIIISADAMKNQIDKLLEIGARNYLTKPLDVNIFLNTIDEFIEK